MTESYACNAILLIDCKLLPTSSYQILITLKKANQQLKQLESSLFHVSMWCVPLSFRSRPLSCPTVTRNSDALCPWPCRLWSIAHPHALFCVMPMPANCLTGQLLKTTLGLCCRPASYQSCKITTCVIIHYIINPTKLTVSLKICRKYTFCILFLSKYSAIYRGISLIIYI